jgi:hypothetical protein
MFPRGLPGLGLLLLRLSVASALLLDTCSHRAALPGWVDGIAIVISLGVTMGYLTPIVAAATLAFHASIGVALGVDLNGAAVAMVLSLDALALALLGPGAYSIDSRRFGRRLVVLPPQ